MALIKKNLLLLILAFGLCSCIDNKHNYNKIDTGVHLFENGVTLNIGSTKPVNLSSLLDTANLEYLLSDTVGNYSIAMGDSIKPINLLENVTLDPIKLNAPDLKPIEITFNDKKLPPFSIPEVKDIVEINLEDNPLDNFNTNNPVLKNDLRLNIPKIEANPYSEIKFPKITQQIDGTNNSLNFIINSKLPTEIKSVNSIKFTNNSIITVSIDRRGIPNINGLKLNHKIDLIKLNAPEGFKLYIPNSSSIGSIINNGRTFIAENINAEPITKIFIGIENITLPDNIYNDNQMNYSDAITAEFTYSLDGNVAPNTSINADTWTVKLNVDSDLKIEDLNVSTNKITIKNSSKSIVHKETIDLSNVKDIVKVNTISFKNSPAVHISTSKLNINNIPLCDGELIVDLPSTFLFNNTLGDASKLQGNKLIIKHSDIGKEFSLHIDKIIINKDVTVENDKHFIVLDVNSSVTSNKLTLEEANTNAKDIFNKIKAFDYAIKFDEFEINGAEFEIQGLTETLEPQIIDFDINQKIDPILKSIQSIDFKDNLNFEVTLVATGIANIVDTIKYRNIKIGIPEFVKLNSSKGHVNKENQIIIDEEIIPAKNGEFTCSFDIQIEGVDFKDGLDLNNGILNIIDKITLEGDMHIPGQDISSDKLEPVSVQTSINISEAEINRIAGQVNFDEIDMDDFNSSVEIELDETILSGFKNIDINNPEINLVVGNSSTLNIDARLKLTATYADGSKGQFSRDIHIDASENAGINKNTNITIRNQENKDLTEFLKQIPKQIDISCIPTLNDEVQELNLIEDNIIQLSYDINIPLSFGEDFEMEYNTEFENIGESIAEIINVSTAFTLYIDAESTIPVDLQLTAYPLDINKNDISKDLHLSIDKQITAGTLEKPAKSVIIIRMKENIKGAVNNLESIELCVKAKTNSTFGGAKFNENQGLKLNLKVSLPEGINLNLKDL